MKLWRYGQAIAYLGKRYRLENLLGSGAVADVCLAWDEREQREVAIKVVKSDDLDQDTLGRFQQEARHAARLDHPHILRVYGGLGLELVDKERKSIVPYIVMEYARGGDLHKRLAQGQPYPFEQALNVFEQICEAVQYAHDQGIIHRDIKPLNILFRRPPDGAEEAVLSDFGLAVSIDATHHTFAHGGTLAYMAPEQFTGQAEPASDIFALGVILYQLCTGRLPFRRALQDLHRPEMVTLPPLPGSLNPTLPPALDAVIMRALDDDPARRYPGASAFWQAVSCAIVRPAPPLSMPDSPARRDERGAQSIAVPTALGDDLPVSLSVLAEQDAPIALTALRRGAQTPLPDTSIPEDKPIPLPALSKMAGSRTRHVSLPRRAIVTLPVVLLVALISGGLAVAAPGLISSFTRHPGGGANPLAPNTVTITPKSQKLSNSFTIIAVTGTPNPGQRQVQARVLTVTTAPSRTTASATGHTQTPSTNATGTLTFYNAASYSQSVIAGTVFNVSGGVQIENTATAVIPGANPPTAGQVTVPARALTAGAKGNILAKTLNGVACCSTGIAVSNLSAFSGGQDAQNFTFIQQNDVDNAAAPLVSQLKTQAMSTVAGQKHAGEQFVKEPACSTKVVTNPPVGAHANSTTVTVTATCSGEVYDASGAQALAANLLKQQAAANPGSHYVLVGSVQTGAPQVAAINSQTNTVELLVQAAGVWEYQFSDVEKAQLAQLIAGKTKDAAQAILLQQPGVAQVDGITFAKNSTVLPTDATQIGIVIQNVSGQPGITPAPSGTPVTGNG